MIGRNEVHIPMKRNRSIDIIRGIAILSIIFGHLGVFAIDRIVFTFHVPIFYIITGYYTTVAPPVPFIKKKARRLLVPYAVTCVCMIVIAAVIALVNGTGAVRAAMDWLGASLYASGGNYSKPFPIKQIGAIWFLWASFWGSLGLQISLRWRPAARLGWVMILFAMGYLTAKHLFWFPLSLQAGCCATLYMALGYCLRQHGDALRRLPDEVKLTGTVMAFVMWLSFIAHYRGFWMGSCDIGRGVEDIFGSLCACCCVMEIARMIDRYTKGAAAGLAFLGRYSIIVLCVHITEMNMIEWRGLIAQMVSAGIPELVADGVAVGAKLLLIITCTVLLSKSRIARKVFAV